jgi:uncharacterized protein involved in outer membrane biogenesis
MKKILIGLAALVVIVAVAVYFLLSNLEGILKAAIERYGSAATKAQVRVERVRLSARSGEAGLTGLVVGNPQGFSTPTAFVLGDIRMKLDVGTLTAETIVVKEIVIVRPQITYERGERESNLDAIRRNAADYSGRARGGGSEGGGGRKLVIDHLYVRDGQIGISHSALGGRALTARLPDIHLRDIGKSQAGVTVAEVIEQLLAEVGKSASQVARADLERALKESVGGAAQEVGQRLRGILGR